MKKLIITFSALVAFLALFIILSYFYIATIIGSILSSSFGAKTTIDSAILTPSKLTLSGLSIRNPKEAKYKDALTIAKFSILAPITTYLGKDIKIYEIALDDLILDIEVIGGKGSITNLDSIINNATKEKEPTSTSDRNTTIDTLSINNITINYTDPLGNLNVTKIKNLTFKNLSTKNGDITSQIAKTILLKILFDVKNISKIPLKLSTDSVNTFLKQINIPIKIKE